MKHFSCNQKVTSHEGPQKLLDLAFSFHQRQHMVADALHYSHGSHTVDDVLGMILRGEALWWPLANGFLITEVNHYPRQKHLHVFLAGGDLSEVKQMHDTLVYAARQAGCSALTLTGRRGWVKSLQDLGWKEQFTTVIFDIPTEPENVETEQHDDDL